VSTVPAASAANPSDPGGRTFGILSSFPPTSCGIATFSAALAAGLVAAGSSVDVVRCGPPPPLEDPLVVAALPDDASREAIAEALGRLNATDLVVVQHEYGLYAGEDGRSLVGFMDGITVPIVVVAHTVGTTPTAGQRSVLEAVVRRADAVVVMTETARERLVNGYTVDPARIIVIPHGAATPAPDAPGGGGRHPSRPPTVLTWGLLGPGKGIEWAIDAIAELDDIQPHYLVAGATHPKVREHHGEAYRTMLVDRAARSGAGDRITFDDTYLGLARLTELIRSVDLVVLPYDSVDQVTSGVLVDAVAAGRPVIATQFPHAVELLASGAGIVVPQRDSRALADAIRSVFTEPGRADAMAAEARRLAPALSWGAVALRYAALADRVLAERPVGAT
jgi:polysaccharide biosynthesis protein PslF